MSRPPPDRGLDGLNLLSATMGTAYGAFIPVYLTAQAWTQTSIGLALTIATVVSTICQVPAGMLVDWAGAGRRRLMFGAIVIIGLTPLVLAAFPQALPVMLVLALQSAAGTLLSPTIAAVSLAVAGRDGFGERLGRNARFGSIGAGTGAAVMGLTSTFISHHAVFLIAAAMLPLALWAATRIGPDREGVGSAEPAGEDAAAAPGWRAPLRMLRNRRVLVFATGLMLFQFASIAVLQLAAVDVTAREGSRAGLFIAAFVIVPQAIVALISPALGAWAGTHGRRPALILSFATTPIRALGFALVQNPYFLVGVQLLEGAGGAAFGVMMPLVAADLTRGTRRYTLCLGFMGLASTAGAALSTVVAGVMADRFGRAAAFGTLALAGLAATLLVLFAMPETHPRQRPAAGLLFSRKKKQTGAR